MKSGKCPKCNQRNVSRYTGGEESLRLGVLRRGLIDALYSLDVNVRTTANEKLEGLESPRSSSLAPTVIYACSDCHYSETYMSEEDFPKPLETYEGWERVSAPANGPFR